MNPFQLKDRLIAVLQMFFADDTDYTYLDDQEQTKIVIADAFGVDRKEVEKFPAIAVERLVERELPSLFIGDLKSLDWAAKYGDMPKETRVNMIGGRMACHCLSTNGIEAEMIAVKVLNFLLAMKAELRPILMVSKLEGLEMGREQRVKEWPGQIDVPVLFNYVYPVVWIITDKELLIKKISLKNKQV